MDGDAHPAARSRTGGIAVRRPVVGLFGAFDTGELGEVALRRVLENELTRRRPDIDVVALAPFGAERSVPGDEGRPARPLPHDGAAAGLGLDALIVAGDVLAGERAWAVRYPVAPDVIAERGVEELVLRGEHRGAPAAGTIAWFAVGMPEADPEASVPQLSARSVWARDADTLERLGRAALQSGDPLLLSGRVFAADTLRKRADLLRMCGALPPGRRLVVELSRHGDAGTATGLGAALGTALGADPRLVVIVVSLDPGAPGETWPLHIEGLNAERLHHFPAWAGLDDVAAALSGAAAVVASSPAGAALASSFEVPVVAVATERRGRFDAAIPLLDGDLAAGIASLLASGKPPTTGEAVGRLEEALDALAATLPSVSGTAEGAPPEPPVSALAVLQQRLADERTALAAELSRLQAELDHMRASPEHRIAKPVRDAYERWQKRRT